MCELRNYATNRPSNKVVCKFRTRDVNLKKNGSKVHKTKTKNGSKKLKS